MTACERGIPTGDIGLYAVAPSVEEIIVVACRSSEIVRIVVGNGHDWWSDSVVELKPIPETRGTQYLNLEDPASLANYEVIGNLDDVDIENFYVRANTKEGLKLASFEGVPSAGEVRSYSYEDDSIDQPLSEYLAQMDYSTCRNPDDRTVDQ